MFLKPLKVFSELFLDTITELTHFLG